MKMFAVVPSPLGTRDLLLQFFHGEVHIFPCPPLGCAAAAPHCEGCGQHCGGGAPPYVPHGTAAADDEEQEATHSDELRFVF